MKDANSSAGPLSFVKGVKNKIIGTVFHALPGDEAGRQMEEARQEIKSLKARKESLRSKWILITRRFDDTDSIRIELKKIDEEKKKVSGVIAREEEKLRALYLNKDEHLRELEAARAGLKKTHSERRAGLGDTTQDPGQERDVEKLKERLAEATRSEQDASGGFEEIEMRLKFANANMETLILDSTAAQRAIDTLARGAEKKKESRPPLEKSKLAIDEVVAKLAELKSGQGDMGDSLQEFESARKQLGQVREAIKKNEEEQSVIPRKVAELSAIFGKAKERAELLKKEKSLTDEIVKMKAQEKKIADKLSKDKEGLGKAAQASLQLKHLMMSAGLNDFVGRVDSAPGDILRADIENKRAEIAHSLDKCDKEIAQAQASQAQKRTAITKMRDELNKLSKDAENDKSDVERQREALRKTKEQTTRLRASLEAKLKEKGSVMSEAMDVTMERKRIERLEADAVQAINRIQSGVDALEVSENELLSTLRDEKARLEEMADLERFFTSNLKVVEEMDRLKSVDKEFVLARDVAAKYEADCRRMKDVARQKKLLEVKLVLVDEAEVPVSVLESRLLEMREEHARLEKDLDPLLAEIDFATEKRDNVEMEISFARESLKKAGERRKSLERRMEFVSQESGSVKGIQEKLGVYEEKLNVSEKSVAEVQTRLNFTIATEEVVKENFQNSQANIANIDKQIESIKVRLDKEEEQSSEVRAKVTEYEQRIDHEKGARVEAETNKASSAIELKKSEIEYDGLTEKMKDCEASLQENKEKARSFEEMIPVYNANLVKQKKLKGETEDSRKDVDKVGAQIDECKSQVEDLQSKKRELMEEASESPAQEAVEEVGEDKAKITTLRDERKAVRGQLKELEAKIKGMKVEDASDADKAKAREQVDALRKERDVLHEKIDKINKQLDDIKDSAPAPAAPSAPAAGGSAKNLAAAIGELDIKVMPLTKNVQKLESKLQENEKEFEKLASAREKLSLEIANQEKIIAPLDEIKAKISTLEKERNSTQQSLDDKMSQKESFTQRIKDADEAMATILGTIAHAEKGLIQARREVEAMDAGSSSGVRREFDEATREREDALSEFTRLKEEMDSIMVSTTQDRGMIEQEKIVTEDARREVEDTKKQLAEAMNILTGQTGSVENLKLELASSQDEQGDASDRIHSLEMDLKAATAAIDGIDSSVGPKASRLKYVVWAQGIIDRRLKDSGLRAQLQETTDELKEFKNTRELYDEYNDLSKSRQELQERVGELKSYIDLETQLVTAEQARREAMAQASESAEKVELQEATTKSLEEKYRQTQEDQVHVKGMLDEVTHRFDLARERWGKVEDLSRIADSLELKIREFREQFGAMEKASEKIDRLGKENKAFQDRVKIMEDTCNTLHAEKKSLEAALERTRDDFGGALQLMRKSRDEARKFLYSEAQV